MKRQQTLSTTLGFDKCKNHFVETLPFQFYRETNGREMIPNLKEELKALEKEETPSASTIFRDLKSFTIIKYKGLFMKENQFL